MKFLKIFGFIILGLAVIAGIGLYYFSTKVTSKSFVKYFKEHPKDVAMYYQRDGKVLINKNSDQVMPLASTVKIIVAIEYAKQVAARKINPSAMIDTAILDNFYLPNTDGGAHPAWLAEYKKNNKVFDGKIDMRSIVQGMMRYSSNANTEFLMDTLGLDSINANLMSLNMPKHQKLYPIVSSLFVIQAKKMQVAQMPMDTFISECNKVHAILKSGDKSLRKNFTTISMDLQKIWSDRLIGSTAFEYGQLMEKLNSKTYFLKEVTQELDQVLEGMMKSEEAIKYLQYGGSKGGSTAFVLTKALYAKDKQGHTTNIAFLINNITGKGLDGLYLQTGAQEFIWELIGDDKQRDALISQMNQ